MQDDVIIRRAAMDEIDRVMLFLKEHWGENHIMANHRELMCYEHAWNGEFTFVIAEDSRTGQLYGVCGYIPYSGEMPKDMGVGIWKVIQNPHFLLGVELFRYVQEQTGCRMLADCGANPKTKGHRKLMGHINAKLDHWYRLNPDVKTYSIAVVNERKIAVKRTERPFKLIELTCIEQFKERFDVSRYRELMPYKDNDYIEHRYYRHIKYRYRVMGIDNGNRIDAVVIGREVCPNGQKAFRIIDFLGNEASFAGTFDAWRFFMTAHGYEYIDFYEYGLNQEYLADAGFFLRDESDGNIIPNYFEPFEQRNVEIHISTNIHGSFRMFKGDGDQDRPNVILDANCRKTVM